MLNRFSVPSVGIKRELEYGEIQSERTSRYSAQSANREPLSVQNN